jgi:hypothetical protein
VGPFLRQFLLCLPTHLLSPPPAYLLNSRLLSSSPHHSSRPCLSSHLPPAHLLSLRLLFSNSSCPRLLSTSSINKRLGFPVWVQEEENGLYPPLPRGSRSSPSTVDPDLEVSTDKQYLINPKRAINLRICFATICGTDPYSTEFRGSMNARKFVSMIQKKPFPSRSRGRSVALGTARVAEGLALHRDKAPLIALWVQR